MEITISAGFKCRDIELMIVISNAFIYLQNSTSLMIRDMKGELIHTITTRTDLIEQMIPTNKGVLYNTDNSVFTLSTDGIIRLFTDQLFTEIYKIASLRNGNVAILTQIFLYIYTETGDLVIRHRIHDKNNNMFCRHMTLLADGGVGVLLDDFMHIYTSTGKTETPVYIPNVGDHGILTELYDGRFCTITRYSYMMIWPRGNGRLSYSTTAVSLDKLTQLFDGKILTIGAHKMHILTVEGVLDKTIAIDGYEGGIFQLPDSRLLLVSKQYITIYMLDGTIDSKFDCGELIQTVTFDDKDKLVYICEDDTMRIFTVPPKRSVYKPRLDMFSDMNVRFN